MNEMAATEPGVRPRALSTVEALLRATVIRDAEAIVDCYAKDEELHVFVEGPRWQTVGYEAVAGGWRAFCESAFRVTAIEIIDGPRVFGEDAAERVGAHATVVAMTRLTYEADGEQEVRQMDLRLTWVLRREPDRWRIIHEHGSQPAADPYGTGDWLAKG